MLEKGAPRQFYDTFEGSDSIPGHAYSRRVGLFSKSAVRGKDRRLIEPGTKIIDWSLELGWDSSTADFSTSATPVGLSCMEYSHDMKFWWPHNEAIIATSLAYQLTDEEKYARSRMVHDWAYSHFPDPFGEWFGYPHRDGSVAHDTRAPVGTVSPVAYAMVLLATVDGNGVAHPRRPASHWVCRRVKESSTKPAAASMLGFRCT